MLETYSLPFNPFYEKSDHDLVGDSRQKQLGSMKGDIEKVIAAQAPFFIIIRGTVGIGKSFTLEVLRDNLKSTEQVFAVKFDASWGTSPTKYIQYICNSVFRAISEKNFQKLIEKFQNTVKENETTEKEFLKTIHRDFKNAILHYNDNQEAVWSWLIGEKVDLRSLKNIGIINRIESQQYSLQILDEFSKFLKLLGYQGLAFCIDEGEELALTGTSRSIQILTILKKIWEHNKTILSSEDKDDYIPMIFAIGFTPETWQLLSGDSLMEKEKQKTGAAGLSTFLRRMGSEYILEPFTNADAKKLITVLLNIAREKSENSLEPFTDDAIEYINSVTRGIPYHIMRFCNKCIDIGNEKKESEIDKAKASEYLVDAGLISEMESSTDATEYDL